MAGKILVLAGNGTVGAPLVDLLSAHGEVVRVASRNPGPSAKAGVEPVRLDLNAPTGLSEAFEGVDRAYFLAPAGYLDQDKLLAPLIRAAAERGVKIVIQTAMGVDADDSIPLRRAELAIQASGVPFVILRPNWFADNFGTYWKAHVDAGRLRLPAGDGATSFIDASDIAASAAAALTRSDLDGQAFVLTGPEALTYAQAADLIGRVTGRRIAYERVDPDTFVAESVRAGLPEDYARFLSVIFGVVAQGWAAAVTDHVEKLTGHAPKSLLDHLTERQKRAA